MKVLLKILGLVMLTSLALPCFGAAGYLRIGTSEDAAMYVKIDGAELRMAETVEKLDGAEPVKGTMRGRNIAMFSGVQLPAPQKEGKSSCKTDMRTYPRGDTLRVTGMVQTQITDAEGVLWTYVSYLNAQAASTPEKAPLVKLLSTDGAEAKMPVVAKPQKNGAMGIGVTLTINGQSFRVIMKGGSPVMATVTTLDQNGKEVAKATKKLADFGFG